MAERRSIVVGALNVVADPHPVGIYIELLAKAANREISVWGSDKAKITPPKQHRNDENIVGGRILVWTEIEKDGPWIDKRKNDRASEDDKKTIQIPDQLEPNFRSFQYIFNVKRHRLIVEYQNDQGQRFGPSRALKLFSQLLSRQVLGPNAPEVTVTTVPQDGSVEKILSIPRLRRLHIHLERPNPDDLAEDEARILKNLEKEGARSRDIVLQKARGVQSLSPSNDTQTVAKVAAVNGYVDGSGRDAEGKPVDESTKKHPKRLTLNLEPDQSAIARLLGSLNLL